MATVPDLSGNNPLYVSYVNPTRTAADQAAVMALTPAFPGEVVIATTTGVRYCGTGPAAGKWMLHDE